MIDLKKVRSALLGFAVGNALGVPVEFSSKEEREADPVVGMRGYGIRYQPPGVWSADTSLVIATMESVAYLKKIDACDIMKNFAGWYKENLFTATGHRFGIDFNIQRAINAFLNGTPIIECGLGGVLSNSNSSLARMLPMVFYPYDCDIPVSEALTKVGELSSLTHAHFVSIMACELYYMLAHELLKGENPANALSNVIKLATEWYCDPAYAPMFGFYSRLLSDRFASLPENEIRGTGYVVDTLEAVVWCLLNTTDYKSLVLKAVNLGDDTDTVAAIAGGLGGILYGEDGIPVDWLDVLKRKEYLEEIAQSFYEAISFLHWI